MPKIRIYFIINAPTPISINPSIPQRRFRVQKKIIRTCVTACAQQAAFSASGHIHCHAGSAYFQYRPQHCRMFPQHELPQVSQSTFWAFVDGDSEQIIRTCPTGFLEGVRRCEPFLFENINPLFRPFVDREFEQKIRMNATGPPGGGAFSATGISIQFPQKCGLRIRAKNTHARHRPS